MKGSTPISSPRDQMVKNLRHMGVYGSVIHTHRSMATFKLPTEAFVNFLGIPLILILLCILAFPYMTYIWKDIFSFAHGLLGFPGELKMTPLEVLPLYFLDIPSYTMNAEWPTTSIIVDSGMIVCALLLSTLLFSDRMIPVAYLIRAVCVIQITAIGYFAIASPPFPYHLSAYTGGILRAGIIIILLTPVLFALTLYVFRMSLLKKLIISLMTMGHLAVFIPLQMLVHVYLVKSCSFIVMPVMFFMFGLILDVLLIIAFYSWGISWVDITKQ